MLFGIFNRDFGSRSSRPRRNGLGEAEGRPFLPTHGDRGPPSKRADAISRRPDRAQVTRGACGKHRELSSARFLMIDIAYVGLHFRPVHTQNAGFMRVPETIIRRDVDSTEDCATI
jgi:hypothetical protein